MGYDRGSETSALRTGKRRRRRRDSKRRARRERRGRRRRSSYSQSFSRAQRGGRGVVGASVVKKLISFDPGKKDFIANPSGTSTLARVEGECSCECKVLLASKEDDEAHSVPHSPPVAPSRFFLLLASSAFPPLPTPEPPFLSLPLGCDRRRCPHTPPRRLSATERIRTSANDSEGLLLRLEGVRGANAHLV